MQNSSSYQTTDLISSQVFGEQFLNNLKYSEGVDLKHADGISIQKALSSTVMHYLVDRWQQTRSKIHKTRHVKTVAYLSAEYLLGTRISISLLATNLTEVAREALENMGLNIDDVMSVETEPGLGNGGLGRLAACYLDSLATMEIPAVGYGIRYKYGIFTQTFNQNGEQIEIPDYWLENGTFSGRPFYDKAQVIGFGGNTIRREDENGVERVEWIPQWTLRAVPYTYLIPGYDTGNVNSLRLWEAKSVSEFNLEKFNLGHYEAAVAGQTYAENVSKVLYPEDSTPQGKELRLQQQYFFASASIKDILRSFYEGGANSDLRNLPDKVVFQLNDTHPVVAVPELMRAMVDIFHYDWDVAWEITKKCFNYTCHTLLPEALEVWDVDLFSRLLPRHFEIICKINDKFLEEATEKVGKEKAKEMSIFTGDCNTGGIRMAYLATIASQKVNGVAELHSKLLKDNVLPDFHNYYPGKFTNVTNGVTPRRFLKIANPNLSELITDTLGSEKWIRDLNLLSELEDYADNELFLSDFLEIKGVNKVRFADAYYSKNTTNVINTNSLFDVMVKRLHEYKRQTLKLLHVITLYNRIKAGEVDVKTMQPRTIIFGAKAAPGYFLAKQTIKLINSVAHKINSDPALCGKLAVIFPANYNVSMAEKLIPSADLSEQISLAGLEASGTGNMKLAMNGALTVGTLDGANVEIREHVGEENFFLFGMVEKEVAALFAKGYTPKAYYDSNPELKRAIDTISSGEFSITEKTTFDEFVNNLLYEDRFAVLADYQAYIDIQGRIEEEYQDKKAWGKKAILNVSRMGYFSSDRAIGEYVKNIWNVRKVSIKKPIYSIRDLKVINL
jgi:starch phosphorylase